MPIFERGPKDHLEVLEAPAAMSLCWGHLQLMFPRAAAVPPYLYLSSPESHSVKTYTMLSTLPKAN